MVDNLFIYRNIVCIQAKADGENKAAQRVLEEWKEPKILTRTT
jgi:hypothetical protein